MVYRHKEQVLEIQSQFSIKGHWQDRRIEPDLGVTDAWL